MATLHHMSARENSDNKINQSHFTKNHRLQLPPPLQLFSRMYESRKNRAESFHQIIIDPAHGNEANKLNDACLK